MKKNVVTFKALKKKIIFVLMDFVKHLNSEDWISFSYSDCLRLSNYSSEC